MSMVIWRAIVFIAVVRSFLLLLELGGMASLAGSNGALSVIERRFDSALGISTEIVALAICFFWLLRIMRGTAKNEKRYEWSHATSPQFYPGNGTLWDSDDDNFWVPNSIGSVTTSDHDSEWINETGIRDSVNPASGLPMVGDVDVEGNVFGTDSFSDVGCGFDDHFSMDCSDSLFDDELSGFSDDWV